ncbi:hypothetical protein [Dyella silvae]|uniref:hypothetical protein n=1 Tax=Dyella silvae TaxID=2994424 RepID=UPI002263EAA9|nr:hypothetical protein [Dyella silvae]
MRSLINLCAVQGVAVNEFLAAPRETSGSFLFERWGGLNYMPLPTPRQAQKIYVARQCLKEFLRLRPTYLPPISLFLRPFNVQLLAIRDVDDEAYDFYEAAHFIQGDSIIQKRLQAAFLSAKSLMSTEASGSLPALDWIAARVAGRAEVALALAEHATRSAALVRQAQAEEIVERYEKEMPADMAVDWFVQNRRCSWSGTS